MTRSRDAGDPATSVCIISTVHPWNDPRIFWKQSRTLVEAGYRVHLVVCDEEGEYRGPIQLHRLPKTSYRCLRLSRAAWLAYRKAKRISGSIVHIHDPELLPVGLLLKLQGRIVIYDVHEDLPKQILDKTWIPRNLRRPVAWLANKAEGIVARRLDAVIAATPKIQLWFPTRRQLHHYRQPGTRRAVVVGNFPRLEDFSDPGDPWTERPLRVCYVGVIAQPRGIFEMLRSVSQTPARLVLAGRFDSKLLRQQCLRESGWDCVDDLGILEPQQVAALLRESRIGLCLLHGIPKYLDALPTKVFEYMAAGLPVVASPLPALREIVEGSGGGICVNPDQPQEVAAAIRHLLENPQEAQAMGQKGMAAVAQRYHWSQEAAKLRTLYRELAECQGRGV